MNDVTKQERIDQMQNGNHYLWLDLHLPVFLERLGLDPRKAPGLISAHGDKFYSQRDRCEREGIHFFHGVAIYLLTYVSPYSDEVRETSLGWVCPNWWVFQNAPGFVRKLPPVVDDWYNTEYAGWLDERTRLDRPN